MEINENDNLLIIKAGLLFPEYKLIIKGIKNWEFVAEENGATYFSFIYKDSTQHVSIPKMKPDELLNKIEQIQSILNLPPKLLISNVRVSKEELWIATDVTLSLLASILISAKF